MTFLDVDRCCGVAQGWAHTRAPFQHKIICVHAAGLVSERLLGQDELALVDLEGHEGVIVQVLRITPIYEL